MDKPRHITHIEWDGTSYYWWCEHPECGVESGWFATEADCAASGAAHEEEAG
jgi:hypothetical protein